ncbi:MAG: AmmeMemoRadiSam system protein A [Deltaproteobacteria bacterium]|jgi:AmmeMemoRadiSam system protein A|nr:AmmeMemoRadiSam system protein A [Deltaproteobacteria bacterium]
MPDKEQETIDSNGLSESLKKEILLWSRDILDCRLQDRPLPKGPNLNGLRGGVFVTLKKKGKLRGCIGRFDFSPPLAESIKEMVQAAAFQDPRFPPLDQSELAALDITISVLSEPKPLSSLDDLVIGRDGLYLIHPRGRGVLLPVVAVEQGWSALEFANHTAIKAGLPSNAWHHPETQLMVFTAPAFSTDS